MSIKGEGLKRGKIALLNWLFLDKYIDEEIIEKVDNLMESKGFKRNIEKTYYMNK